MKFASILALASFILPALCAPVVDIKVEVKALGDSCIAFADAITALSPTLGQESVVQVKAIATASASVVANLGVATASVLVGIRTLTAPIPDTEGIELLDYVQTIVPVYVDALVALDARKADIAALLEIGLVSPLAAIKQALVKVRPFSVKFNAAVAAHVFSASIILPVVLNCITYVVRQDNLVGEWNELVAQITAAQATAIAVYSA
ncbi:hypothetical protein C0991_007459 [Blastosporella zonata]|nr:hypothetical protein C0991_007459 [Blastosporella zonata]